MCAGQCLQVGVHSGQLRVRYRLGERVKPTFRLPLTPVWTPYGRIGVGCVDTDEDVSVLRNNDLVHQLPIHPADRFGEGKDRLFAGPKAIDESQCE